MILAIIVIAAIANGVIWSHVIRQLVAVAPALSFHREQWQGHTIRSFSFSLSWARR